jgi:hypothetical protein
MVDISIAAGALALWPFFVMGFVGVVVLLGR